jgi:D-glycero-D-manno-heptose 1,7-bisphosphate phosphatase
VNDKRPQVIVLDRDGVINRDSPEFVKTIDEWVPLPGSLEAIATLSRAGFLVTVATNQSGVGRGLLTAEILGAIHKKMTDSIRAAGGRLDGIFVCPHRPDDGCDCRKPNPGMLQQIASRFCCDPAGLHVIGDSIRDLEAPRQLARNRFWCAPEMAEKPRSYCRMTVVCAYSTALPTLPEL